MSGGSSGGTTSKPLTGPERAQAYDYGMKSIGNTTMFNQPYYQYDSPDYIQSNIYDPGNASQASYTGGQIYDAGDARQMANGDYDRLEQSIVQSRTAPLLAAYGTQSQRLDSDLAKRGIWSSGAATQAQNDLTTSFLPQLTQAGSDAAAQRYGMQQQDLNAYNQYGLTRAGQLTSASQNEAQNANNFALTNSNQNNQYNLARAGQLTSAGQSEAQNANSFNMENANRNMASAWKPAEFGLGLYNNTGGTVSSGGGGWNFMI